MHLGIDGNEANIPNRVGVNKYAFEIIWGIYKLQEESKHLIVTVYLKADPLPDMPKATDQFKYKILRGGRVWIVTKLMPYLFFAKDKPDVFFTPSHYLPPFLPMSSVCSIMDLGYLEFSGQFRKYDYWQLKWWTARSISISKYVMCISNATAKDIMRHYPASDGKEVVTYPGYDENLTKDTISARAISDVKDKYSIVKDYILYLGTLKPSKNIEGLVKAFQKVHGVQLVIAGKKGWLYDSVFGLVKQLGLEKDVVFTDFVYENDKNALIKGAKCFVLPSFWEGFGLDILSSFALKTPVVVAKVGSIPEVGGDAAIYVDPYSVDSITEGLAKVLKMTKKEYNELVARGVRRLAKFSWERAARQTLEACEKAATSNK